MQMKPSKNLVIVVSLLVVTAATFIVVSPSRDDLPEEANALTSTKRSKAKPTASKNAKAKKIRAKNESPIAIESDARLHAELAIEDDEYSDLTPEMKRLMAEIQRCLDAEDRKALSKVCDRISKIRDERGYDAIPASVRAKAVEAIGLFLPDTLAELVEFMADSDPEVADSVSDQLDTLLNDTTVGDKELSGMLVTISKVLTNEDAIDSLAMSIDCNMRNSVKVKTYCQILDTGTTVAVARMKEAIAELMEVEVSELPANTVAIKNKLNEWLEVNPDGEEDNDFYKGVED
ncbi:MAG: hypothetical protein J5727_10925 [Kiritimatiellae bacterium]|nr:hypothetical protein [Kiritimatiellia bacterium]